MDLFVFLFCDCSFNVFTNNWWGLIFALSLSSPKKPKKPKFVQKSLYPPFNVHKRHWVGRSLCWNTTWCWARSGSLSWNITRCWARSWSSRKPITCKISPDKSMAKNVIHAGWTKVWCSDWMNVALIRPKYFLFVIVLCETILANLLFWRDLVAYARKKQAI